MFDRWKVNDNIYCSIHISIGFKSSHSHRLSQISEKDANVEEYWFFCQKWFDAKKGDRQTVRELLPTDQQGKMLSDQQGSTICMTNICL
jgi:hypothetical protein